MLGKALGKPLNKMLMDTGKEGIKGSGNGMTKGTKGAICYGKDSHHFFLFPQIWFQPNDGIYNVLNF